MRPNAPLNILFLWFDSVSEFDGMVEPTFPEFLAANRGSDREEFRFKRFQSIKGFTGPSSHYHLALDSTHRTVYSVHVCMYVCMHSHAAR